MSLRLCYTNCSSFLGGKEFLPLSFSMECEKQECYSKYSGSDIAWHLPIRMETLPNQSKWNPVDTQGESDSANKEGNESGFVRVLKEGCKILCSWHLNSNQRRESTKLLWCGCHAQFCLILCDPMAGSLPGSSVHGIFQARILEWVAISASRALPDPETESMSLVSPTLALHH